MFQIDIYMYFKLFSFDRYFFQADFVEEKEKILKSGIFQGKAQWPAAGLFKAHFSIGIEKTQ